MLLTIQTKHIHTIQYNTTHYTTRNTHTIHSNTKQTHRNLNNKRKRNIQRKKKRKCNIESNKIVKTKAHQQHSIQHIKRNSNKHSLKGIAEHTIQYNTIFTKEKPI